jgi:predicted CoA-binding protein
VAGKVVSGETVRASLSEIDEPVDMVDIFRKSGDVPQIVAEALEYLPMVKTIWMQLGVMNSVAAQTAREKGLFVVENSCLAIELPRLRSAGHRV